MNSFLESFKKNKEYLICVDSDGCAMDTMSIKHIKCFGPCMVEEWKLNTWEKEILTSWNNVNLYTMTRGINRFQGLLTALKEIHEQYTQVDGINILEDWVTHTSELSNTALEREIQKNDATILKKALKWSETVNIAIQELDEKDKQPFQGVKEALAYAHRFADIAIVSSANLQAVVEEWDIHGLLEHTDVVLVQEVGSKAYCIRELEQKGYEKDKILMTGDALGDYKAALANDVFYYPILVQHEVQSWIEFKEQAVSRLVDGNYEGIYQTEKIDAFMNNLKQ